MSGAAIEYEHHFVGSFGKNFLHHLLYLLQFIHQTYLVVESSCSVYEHNIRSICLCAAQCVESHRCRVAAHLLFYYRHVHAITPDAQLFHGCCPKCVRSTKIYFLSSVFKLVCKFTDCSGFADTVYTHHENDVWFVVCGQVPVVVVPRVVLRQEGGYFLTQDGVELRCAYILVASHTFFYSLYYLECCVNADIACYEYFLEVVEHFVVNLRFSCYGTSQLVKDTCLCLFQPLVEGFLLVFVEKSEYSHTVSNLSANLQKKNDILAFFGQKVIFVPRKLIFVAQICEKVGLPGM